ncbi:hypothetical protein Bca4012_055840 [Brassica carinata]
MLSETLIEAKVVRSFVIFAPLRSATRRYSFRNDLPLICSSTNQSGRCSSVVEARLIRFLEARKVKCGGELMWMDLLMVDVNMRKDRDRDQEENSLYQALSLKTLLADYLLLIAYEGTHDLSYHIASPVRVVIRRPKLLPGLHVQSTYNYSQKWYFLSVWSHAQLTLASHCVLTLAPSSSSSDENAQSFTLRAPSKLKTTTQVVALNRCC